MLGCRVAIRVAGQVVANIVAQQVLSEIKKIASSRTSVLERCAEAAKRIEQFKAALAAVRHQPGAAEGQKESLRRVLQRTVTRHDVGAAENGVYATALDVLMGNAR
jgi:hypothetical protein